MDTAKSVNLLVTVLATETPTVLEAMAHAWTEDDLAAKP